MINYNIKIDVSAEKTCYSNIVFTSGDVRAYKFVFDFAGIDVSNCSLGVKAKRADGTVVTDKSDDCSGFVLPANMYSKPGEVWFEIGIYDATGGCVTTKVVAATVREGFGEEGIGADDRYPVLTTMITEVNALKISVENAISELGDISTALDEIIAIQEAIIGGVSL